MNRRFSVDIIPFPDNIVQFCSYKRQEKRDGAPSKAHREF